MTSRFILQKSLWQKCITVKAFTGGVSINTFRLRGRGGFEHILPNVSSSPTEVIFSGPTLKMDSELVYVVFQVCVAIMTTWNVKVSLRLVMLKYFVIAISVYKKTTYLVTISN